MNVITKKITKSSFGLSAGWNLVYALFNGALALCYRSWWFLTMSLYYAVLGLLKATILKVNDNGLRKAVRFAGFGMIFMSVIISGTVYLSIAEMRNSRYHYAVMIAIAAYTFYLIIHSLIEVIRAHKKHDVRQIVLRNIAFVGAIGSMLSLERSMLGTFGDVTDRFTPAMEMGSGAAAFVLIALIGIFTIRSSRETE